MGPDLEKLLPKTITSLGTFNCIINLSHVFDVLPLVENDEFKMLRFKYDGMIRDCESGGAVNAGDVEFKNSITMEILDKEFDKIRAVKINCRGVHMCGNRSISKTKKLIQLIADTINETNRFMIRFVKIGWGGIQRDSYFDTMKYSLFSILPVGYTSNDISALDSFFRSICENGGLYKSKNRDEEIAMENFRTVMINFGYEPDGCMKTKAVAKEDFIEKIMENINKAKDCEFDIWLEYDNHISSIGWSGSVPLKFVHKKTRETQWITLQLRRGTIVHSGPNIPIMQKAIDFLYTVLI